MKSIVVLGSCLSNLPASMLMGHFGFHRLNNAVIMRSDFFVDYLVDLSSEMPTLSDLESLLGFGAELHGDPRWRIDLHYRDRVGLWDMPQDQSGLFHNLLNTRVDVFLLDNLFDTSQILLRYSGKRLPPFHLHFPLSFAPHGDQLSSDFEVLPCLSAADSARNWVRIAGFLLALQPHAKVFFTCAHSCTSAGDPDRSERARSFASEFPRIISGMPQVEIIPPIEVAQSLTKLPDDRDHFDMRIYNAVAGHIYASMNAEHWPGFAIREGGVQASVKATTIVESFSLKSVVAKALELPIDFINEESGINVTEKWDSLAQLTVSTAVERAYNISLSFEESMSLHSIAAIRAALARRGINAVDDPGSEP